MSRYWTGIAAAALIGIVAIVVLSRVGSTGRHQSASIPDRQEDSTGTGPGVTLNPSHVWYWARTCIGGIGCQMENCRTDASPAKSLATSGTHLEDSGSGRVDVVSDQFLDIYFSTEAQCRDFIAAQTVQDQKTQALMDNYK